MRRADRLFDIVQLLRGSDKPLTAVRIAQTLEVVPRTIYRDIAALQAARVPIEGAAGIGYIMRTGYDLPPLMFDGEEIEAIVLGARLVGRHGDSALSNAAASVLSKLSTMLPEHLSPSLHEVALHAPTPSESVEQRDQVERMVRQAMRSRSKLQLRYTDQHGTQTDRVIWPLGIAYFLQTTVVGGWCELRQGFRAFRTDRMIACMEFGETFDDASGKLRAACLAALSADKIAPFNDGE